MDIDVPSMKDSKNKLSIMEGVYYLISFHAALNRIIKQFSNNVFHSQCCTCLIFMYIITPYDKKTDLNTLLSLLFYSNIDVC